MTVALPKKAALCFYVIMVVPIYICANSQRDGQTDRQTEAGRYPAHTCTLTRTQTKEWETCTAFMQLNIGNVQQF